MGYIASFDKNQYDVAFIHVTRELQENFIKATDNEKEKISGNSGNLLIILSIPYKTEMETECNQNYKVIMKNWIKIVRYIYNLTNSLRIGQ